MKNFYKIFCLKLQLISVGFIFLFAGCASDAPANLQLKQTTEQAYRELWMIQVKQPSEISVNASTHDLNGSIYIAGTYNPTYKPNQMHTMGDTAYYIAKYDRNGKLIFSKTVGFGSGTTIANAVAVDKIGNIYIGGTTSVGLSDTIQVGNNDYFLAKYDTMGSPIWTKQVGIPSGNSQINAIIIDKHNDIYTTGFSEGDLSTHKLNPTSMYFLAKYQPNGKLDWSKQFGNTQANMYGNAIAIDNSDNLYIGGNINQKWKYPNPNYDYFIAKFDDKGKPIWDQAGGNPNGKNILKGIIFDKDKNIYIAGDTNAGVDKKKLIGIQDYFIVKYDQSGNKLWSQEFGDSNQRYFVLGTGSDQNGNLYISGNVSNEGNGNFSLDAFIHEHNNTNGEIIWNDQVRIN